MENFVIAESYLTSIEAHNAKNYLASFGIFSEIIGEISSTSYNVFTPSNGGIKLYVHQKDEAEAKRLLANQ